MPCPYQQIYIFITSIQYFFMKKLSIGLIITSLTILISCTKAIIDEGANTGTIEPIDGMVKYEPHVRSIIFNHCVTCHGGAAPSAGVLLGTYDDVRVYVEDGNLIQRINSSTNPMPPSGLLSAEQRQIIEQWAADGFLP